MRLGLVIYGSLETLSGGYLYDRKLVEYLRRNGDEVEILSMPWVNYAGHLAHGFDSAWLRCLSALKVDVLLQDELNHPSLVLANTRLRRLVPFPLVSIVHHLRGSEQHPLALRLLYRWVERAYLRSLDGFIFNSQTTRTIVQACLGADTPGVVATPGGDRFGSAITEDEIQLRGGSAGMLRLLFVGNLIRRKGLDGLLRGLARLQRGDWRLRVAGRLDAEPKYVSELRSLVEKLGLSTKVDFLGRLDEAQLEREFRGAHLLAVPSQYEGFGIVYLEGMAFGLPGLASRTGAAGEIIQEGQSGWLVNPGHPEEITACLSEVLSNHALLVQMSLEARRRYAVFPTWEESAARIRAYLAGMQ